jgi:hypothetical protein
MIDSEEAAQASGISTGHIQGVGIVVGHGSSASVGWPQPQAQLDLVTLLVEFLDLLKRHEESIEDASSVRESAIAVKSEAEKPSPKWGVVRGLLRGIAASVARVDALTEAVNNIQILVTHSFK